MCHQGLGLEDLKRLPKTCSLSTAVPVLGFSSQAGGQAVERTGQKVLETILAVMPQQKVLATGTSLTHPRKGACERCQNLCGETSGQVPCLGRLQVPREPCCSSSGDFQGTRWGGSTLPGSLPVLVAVGSSEAMQALKEQTSSCEETPSRCSQPQETPGGWELRRHLKWVNQGTKCKGKAEELHPCTDGSA